MVYDDSRSSFIVEIESRFPDLCEFDANVLDADCNIIKYSHVYAIVIICIYICMYTLDYLLDDLHPYLLYIISSVSNLSVNLRKISTGPCPFYYIFILEYLLVEFFRCIFFLTKCVILKSLNAIL